MTLRSYGLFGIFHYGTILSSQFAYSGIKEKNNILCGSGFEIGDIFPNFTVLDNILILCSILDGSTGLELERVGVFEVGYGSVEIDLKVHLL